MTGAGTDRLMAQTGYFLLEARMQWLAGADQSFADLFLATAHQNGT
jgi:hypothetical protein